MPQIKLAGHEAYAEPAKKHKLWIVYTRHANSIPNRVAAYFSEKLARAHAASLVGDNLLVGMETVEICDTHEALT